MQLIVLGMHRSGTSVLARILNMMGAYYGPEGVGVGASSENAKGFWERRDVIELNQEILQALGLDWFQIRGLSQEKLLALGENPEIDRKLRFLALDLDAHRPWMLKDPRLCLLFPLWQKYLELPICLHIYRHPLQVAQSMQGRHADLTIPLPVGIALWEQYNLAALAASSGLPRILLAHRDLLEKPVETVENLYRQLQDFEVQGLRLPSAKEITAFIDPALFRAKGDAALEASYISPAQRDLLDMMESGTIMQLAPADLPPLSPAAQEALQEFEAKLARSGKLRQLEQELQEKSEKLGALQAELADSREHLRQQAAQTLEQRQQQETRMQEQWQQQAAQAQEQLQQQAAQMQQQWQQQELRMQQEATALQQKLNQQTEKSAVIVADLQKDLSDLALQKQDLQQQAAESRLAAESRVAELETHWLCARQDIQKLQKWIEMLAEDLHAVFQSLTWKAGSAFTAALRLVLLRKKQASAPEHIGQTLDEFQHWKSPLSEKKN